MLCIRLFLSKIKLSCFQFFQSFFFCGSIRLCNFLFAGSQLLVQLRFFLFKLFFQIRSVSKLFQVLFLFSNLVLNFLIFFITGNIRNNRNFCFFFFEKSNFFFDISDIFSCLFQRIIQFLDFLFIFFNRLFQRHSFIGNPF